MTCLTCLGRCISRTPEMTSSDEVQNRGSVSLFAVPLCAVVLSSSVASLLSVVASYLALLSCPFPPSCSAIRPSPGTFASGAGPGPGRRIDGRWASKTGKLPPTAGSRRSCQTHARRMTKPKKPRMACFRVNGSIFVALEESLGAESTREKKTNSQVLVAMRQGSDGDTPTRIYWVGLGQLG